MSQFLKIQITDQLILIHYFNLKKAKTFIKKISENSLKKEK